MADPLNSGFVKFSGLPSIIEGKSNLDVYVDDFRMYLTFEIAIQHVVCSVHGIIYVENVNVQQFVQNGLYKASIGDGLL